MISVGFRQSFDNVSQIEERYQNLGAPIELALPWTWDVYAVARKHLSSAAEKIKSFSPYVLSVHAVQAPISDSRILTWGEETASFAKTVGSKYIVVHPNKGHRDRQKDSLYYLRYLTETTGVVFCVETFESRDRVFTINEIIDNNIPMVLDTSHVHDEDRVFRILGLYKDNVPIIHLSSVDGAAQHQRINDFCLEVVRYLRDTKWSGSIILEYLRPYHEFFLNDIEVIRGVLHERK